MAKFAKIIEGAALIAGAVAGVFFGLPPNIALMMIQAGASLVIAGVGTLLNHAQTGLSTSSRNPIAPWNVVYGRAKIGGNILYVGEFGEKNKYLDMVIVLACHPCLSVDSLLFDNQRVLIEPTTKTSFSPTQATVNIASIIRENDVVTVVMAGTINGLLDGDLLAIENVPGDETLNGRYGITVITLGTSFSYICGGAPATVLNAGQVRTTWPDYGNKVYMETVLGDHTQTFDGMLNGTPNDGDTGDLVVNPNNPWTADHLALGKTVVFLRLHYNDKVFSSGLPQISFLLHGKKDIYDPRRDSLPSAVVVDTVVARPTTLLNGWGNNAHVGGYEEGVDQAHDFGLNDDTTYPYTSPGSAFDTSIASYASAVYQHTHKYAGCVWSFATVSPSPDPGTLYLNILSEVPRNGQGGVFVSDRSAGIWYSLDTGATWTQIYDSGPRVKTWDAVTLPVGQNTGHVQVMAFLDAHDDMAHHVFDIHIGTAPQGGGSTGHYTENAALCIADYLANPTWGFRATYGTEIPTAELIAAAHICDEAVATAGTAVESRYALNGTFPLTIKRGEILQNLLTSCGGRLTYVGGKFVIHPAAWIGPAFSIGSSSTIDPPAPLLSGVTAATLTVWATFTNLTSAPALPEVSAFVGRPVPGAGDTNFGVPRITQIAQDQLFDIDASAATGSPLAFTHSLISAEIAQLDVLTVACFIEGTLFAANNLATFRIYDVYLDVTYRDTTTARIRPTRAEYVPGDAGAAGGFVLNPNNAKDADSSPPTGYAEITRTVYNGLTFPGYLLLSSFPYHQQTGGGEGGTVDSSPQIVPPTYLSHMAGPFQWKPKVSSRDLYNGVKGVYISPSNNWQSSDIPPYAQDLTHGYASGSPMYPLGDANLAADGGERRWLEIQLPFTISATTAQRLAKIELLRRRHQGSGTFVFDLAMYQMTALDILQVTLPFLGWDHKLLEITAHRFTVNKQQDASGNDVTLLGTELELKETDPSIYEWDTVEELTPQGFQQSRLPDPKIVAPPTNVVATSDATTAGGAVGGNQDSRLLITWDPPADGYVLNGGHVEVQYQIATSPASSAWVALGTFDPSVTSAYIGGVADGTAYNVRIRSVNAAGVPSDWIVVGPVIADGSRSGDRWKFESPVGVRDGTNPVFTLTFMPDPPESLRLSYAGVDQLQGVDYALTSEESSPVTSPVSNVGTITFLRSENLPDEAAGEWLWAQYQY